MKAQLVDHKSCFEIYLTAETLEEAAKIFRFTTNHTKEMRGISGYANDADFDVSVIIGARKDRTNQIQKP